MVPRFGKIGIPPITRNYERYLPGNIRPVDNCTDYSYDPAHVGLYFSCFIEPNIIASGFNGEITTLVFNFKDTRIGDVLSQMPQSDRVGEYAKSWRWWWGDHAFLVGASPDPLTRAGWLMFTQPMEGD